MTNKIKTFVLGALTTGMVLGGTGCGQVSAYTEFDVLEGQQGQTLQSLGAKPMSEMTNSSSLSSCVTALGALPRILTDSGLNEVGYAPLGFSRPSGYENNADWDELETLLKTKAREYNSVDAYFGRQMNTGGSLEVCKTEAAQTAYAYLREKVGELVDGSLSGAEKEAAIDALIGADGTDNGYKYYSYITVEPAFMYSVGSLDHFGHVPSPSASRDVISVDPNWRTTYNGNNYRVTIHYGARWMDNSSEARGDEQYYVEVPMSVTDGGSSTTTPPTSGGPVSSSSSTGTYSTYTSLVNAVDNKVAAEDRYTGVSIVANKKDVPSGARLSVGTATYAEAVRALNSLNTTVVAAYDFTLRNVLNNTLISTFPNGLTVTVPIPERIAGQGDLYARYVPTNNAVRSATDYDIPVKTVKRNGQYYGEFEVSHFSTYAIIQTKTPNLKPVTVANNTNGQKPVAVTAPNTGAVVSAEAEGRGIAMGAEAAVMLIAGAVIVFMHHRKANEQK